jgi:hypothetical protein
MKKILIALTLGLVFYPLTAFGQKWIEPSIKSDGSQVEGHWQTPEEARKATKSNKGTTNPYTGQINPYNNSLRGPDPINPNPMGPNPFGPDNPRDYRYGR